eukprot:1157246-Pelagomonas_calceolata.AAC.3
MPAVLTCMTKTRAPADNPHTVSTFTSICVLSRWQMHSIKEQASADPPENNNDQNTVVANYQIHGCIHYIALCCASTGKMGPPVQQP